LPKNIERIKKENERILGDRLKMTIYKKGKEILKEAEFNKFRQAFLDSLMKKISEEGRYGADIRPIIEKILKEETFVEFINKLARIIEKKTTISKENCNKVAYTLVEEDIADEIKNILGGQIEEREEKKSKEEKEIYTKGKESMLWDGTKTKRFLGKKPERLKDIFYLFKEHYILKYTIITGFIMLCIAAILFDSIYKAIVVGLTLTIFSGESIQIKIANILAGLGGVLIFFTSLSILIDYIIMIERRSEKIKELARKYCEENIVRKRL